MVSAARIEAGEWSDPDARWRSINGADGEPKKAVLGYYAVNRTVGDGGAE